MKYDRYISYNFLKVKLIKIFYFSSTSLATSTKLIDYETLTIENILYLNNISSELHLNNFSCAIRQQNKLDEFTNESDAFLLNVTFKPVIEIVVLNDENEIIKINDEKIVYLYKSSDVNVAFKCKYSSNPKPNSILWFKNGVLIDNHDDHTGFIDDEFNYRLKQLDESIQNLTCFVNNTNGESQSTIEIKFMCKYTMVFLLITFN